MYQLTSSTAIIRTSDGAIIPADPANVNYQEYLVWVADGNIPDPIPLPTLDEQIADIEVKYKIKFDACAQRFLSITLSDGDNQSSKTVEAQNEYKSLSDQMELEIIELLGVE